MIQRCADASSATSLDSPASPAARDEGSGRRRFQAIAAGSKFRFAAARFSVAVRRPVAPLVVTLSFRNSEFVLIYQQSIAQGR